MQIGKMSRIITELDAGKKQDQARGKQSSNMGPKRECKKRKPGVSERQSKRTVVERRTTLEELFERPLRRHF